MNRLSIAALILLGGQSSRMGQDKAFVCYEGQPLLQRVYQVALAYSQKVYIVTPWPERYETLLTEDYEVILEKEPNQGPLVALSQGLLEIPFEWIWLLACDLPRLQPTLIQRWQSRLTNVSDQVLAVVPQYQSRWEPLCGFYRCCGYSCLKEFIAQGGRSFQRWLTHIPVESIELSEKESQILLNCNQPKDLKP